MKKRIQTQWLIIVLTLVFGIAVGLFARDAFAADIRFTEADAAVQKAIALLQAASFGIPDKPECHRHRDRAIALLEKAREKISDAIACADAP